MASAILASQACVSCARPGRRIGQPGACLRPCCRWFRPAQQRVRKMRKPKADRAEQEGDELGGEEHAQLRIVRKRSVNNPELLGDEIELDIDEMDIQTQWELDRFVNNFNKALNKSRRAAIVNGDIAEVGDTTGAEAVNGAVPALVDNANGESENPDKTTVVAEQVDEYVDIEDEMPTATYQSMEIEKGSDVVSVAGGSGSGSSSSSGSESGSSGGSASEAGNAGSLV